MGSCRLFYTRYKRSLNPPYLDKFLPSQVYYLSTLPNMLSNLTDRTLLLLGAVLCVIAAWCTMGYHHPDEHFQIWEFANYKLGNIPASDLPWEFAEQMRPGLQPFLAYCMVLATRSIDIFNPFIQVFFMRLLSGAAALWVYWSWCKWLENDLISAAAARWMRIGRFSSENTSAISFFGGLLLLVQALEMHKNRFNWKLVVAGILLGLSFFFRYQIAFACIGLGAWLLFIKRPGALAWVALTSGALIAFAIGLACDFWLYGEWVFAPYNYFISNITGAFDGRAQGSTLFIPYGDAIFLLCSCRLGGLQRAIYPKKMDGKNFPVLPLAECHCVTIQNINTC